MNIYPAIDLLGGKVVRLDQGSYLRSTKYSDKPLDIARSFEANGASWLHIIDLDAAKSANLENFSIIKDIVENSQLKIQVGGGVRSVNAAEKLLSLGVERVIIGTTAVKNPDVVADMITRFGPEKIVVSVDIAQTNIATDGWLEASKISQEAFASTLHRIGVQNIIVTDIERDGRMNGPNLTLLNQWLGFGFSVTAAGGVTSIEDISKLDSAGIAGAIIGKSIYENNIDVKTLFNLQSNSGLARRIIPCLDVKDGKVVKGTGFKDFIEMGDPLKLAKYYSEQGADELIFLDIAATAEDRQNRTELVRGLAAEINIPFTIGGGITKLEDIEQLLSAGADKVSIGSAAVRDPNFISSAVSRFGSQAIVVSIDAKQKDTSWKVSIKGGFEMTDIDAIIFAERMAELGVGELLVNSLDRDGTGDGFDTPLLKAITQAVNIPVIASSGVGKVDDFFKVFNETRVTAALAARVFHNKQISIKDVKQDLNSKGILVRL